MFSLFSFTGLAKQQMADLVLLINSLRKLITMTNAELAASLEALSTQLDKVTTELQTEIKGLEDAIATAGGSTPEVDAALAKVKSRVDALDALNADTVVPPADPAPTV